MSRYDRLKGAPWFTDTEYLCLVGGAGGIGSWLSVLLARAGFKVLAYDFDVLEEHNLGGQLYSNKHIGMKKVTALNSIVGDFADRNKFIGYDAAIDENSPTNPFCFSAFDNMKARNEMFAKWRQQFEGDDQAIFIDGRLLAEQMQIFCIKANNPDQVENYISKHLFDDSEVENADCTMKQTSHCAAMIASHMVGFFTNHLTNIVEGENSRNVPHTWEYISPIDLIIN